MHINKLIEDHRFNTDPMEDHMSENNFMLTKQKMLLANLDQIIGLSGDDIHSNTSNHTNNNARGIVIDNTSHERCSNTLSHESYLIECAQTNHFCELKEKQTQQKEQIEDLREETNRLNNVLKLLHEQLQDSSICGSLNNTNGVSAQGRFQLKTDHKMKEMESLVDSFLTERCNESTSGVMVIGDIPLTDDNKMEKDIDAYSANKMSKWKIPFLKYYALSLFDSQKS